MEDIRISVLRGLIRSGEISCKDIEDYLLENLYRHNPALNAFIRVEEEFIRGQFDNLKKKSRELPLYGIPVAIKDNICIRSVETTCASHILSGFIPPYNATVIERLIDNGAILVPNANMDEFAMGSSTEASYFGKTYNPWNREYVPGGSSGGSCVAVASRMVSGALGSDTGGSIRQPASFCGVVGMKPTYGRVSRYGLVAFASSLDQIGPIGIDVRDTAILMKTIAGYDINDSTSVDIPVPDYEEFIGQDVNGIRVGLPREYFVEGLDQEVREAVLNVVNNLQKYGIQVEEISLPHTEYAVATYYIIATAEASSNLARYDGVQYGIRAHQIENLYELYSKTRAEGFGQEVKRRIILGTYVLSAGYYEAYYLKAQKVRTLIREDFKNAFEKVDLIITPTSPTPAFRLGERLDDPLQMYLSDIFTISVNLAGLPAISIPAGFTKDGLPIGLQLIGKAFEEQELFKVGAVCESVSGWDITKRPL